MRYLPPKKDPFGVHSLHFVWNEPNSVGLVNWTVTIVVCPGLIAGTVICVPSNGEINLR